MKNISGSDALFALPRAEFTAARNALAARLKKEGQTAEAQRVKALTRPSATAWAVNQLFWRHRRDFDRLLTINEKVRQAQLERSDDLRSLLAERRKTISALASIAATLMTEAGHAASVDARHRVTTTLESLTSLDRASIELQAGRLTSDLEPLGFESLAALLGGTPLPQGKLLDFRQGAKKKQDGKEKQDTKEKQQAREKENAAAERAARARAEALKLAETALTNARREAARAESAAAKADEQRKALEREKQEIEARHAAALQASRAAADEVRKTARAVADAERALARARSEK